MSETGKEVLDIRRVAVIVLVVAAVAASAIYLVSPGTKSGIFTSLQGQSLISALGFLTINQTSSMGFFFHGGNGSTGYNDLSVTSISNASITNSTLTGYACTGTSCNISIVLDSDNYTKLAGSAVTDLSMTSVFYNASDGSLRNVSELADIGQGNWSFNGTVLNFTLAGGDGYDFGLRDSLPGGSYWINPDGSLYGRVNISNDFITVGLASHNLTVYNSSQKIIFNTSFDNAAKIDVQDFITTYGTGTQNKTVYFFDWANQSWKVWTKGVQNATHGYPDWLDPRNKQEFKWRYAFSNDTVSRPAINFTFLMTAADPFLRTFVDTGSAMIATGGTITYANGREIHTFTTNGTFKVTGTGNVQVLVVAGGGAGGATTTGYSGGGGGAGGVLYASSYVVSNQSYTVTVGAGGATTSNGYCCNGANGQDSFFGSLQAFGGGGGAADYDTNAGNYVAGSNGGSGGGGAIISHPGGNSTQTNNSGGMGYGNVGGTGSATNVAGDEDGGGGGAGGPGANGVKNSGAGGAGGVGLQFGVSGVTTYYGGGGGAGAAGGTVGGAGGLGGGGMGGNNAGSSGVAGTPNTGGGGGGRGTYNVGSGTGGAGGSGIVIVSFPISDNITIPFSLPENKTSVTTAEPGLVGYWNFNEGSGLNVSDSSGNVNIGKLVNGTSWVSNSSCAYGGCLSFNGVNQYVDAGSSSSLNITGPLTLMAWIMTRDNSAEQAIVGKQLTDASSNYLLELYQARLGFTAAGTFVQGPSVSSNVLHHAAVSYDGQNTRFYLDGKLTSTVAIGGNPTANSGSLKIGSSPYPSNLPFNGIIDDVRVYNRELNQSEMQQIFQTGINQQKPGIYFTKNNATDNEEVLFASTNFKNVNRTTPSNFNIISNQTNFFGFNYTFNSTQNQNFLFSLGTMGRMNTTLFNPQTNSTAFSSETMESVANSTMTYYDLSNTSAITATGGTVTYVGGNEIHTFTTNGTFTVTGGSGNIQVLVVGGGGAGGAEITSGFGGGGGGAGGFVYNASYPVTSQSYAVVVGAGGIAQGTNNGGPGGNGSESNFGQLSATGGGGGAGLVASNGAAPGSSGGSGGGAAYIGAVGSANGTQGNAGGAGSNNIGPSYGGGGGGGSNAVGGAGDGSGGGAGGAGTSNSINGSAVTYAGGGGGGSDNGCASGVGGAGGGGTGGCRTVPGTAGTNNTGGGGGAGGTQTASGLHGASGGSGIVIVSFPTNKISVGSGIVQHNSTPAYFYDGGAIGIWHFDEGGGLNATDASGNGNVELTTGTSWVSNSSCRINGCLSFDGSTSFVSGPASATLNGNGSPLTEEAWVYFRSGSGARVMGVFQAAGNLNPQYALLGQAGSTIRAQIVTNGGSFLGTTANADNLFGRTTLSANTWYNLAWTYDNNAVVLYVNGVEDGRYVTVSQGTVRTDSSPVLYIGERGDGAEKCNCLIDEAKIYKRALSAQEISEQYQQGASKYYDDFSVGPKRYYGVEDSNTSLQPIDPTGTVLHYRFNDNSTLNATDSSGTGSMGIMGNGTAASRPTWLTNSSCQSGFGGCMYFDGKQNFILVSNPSAFNYDDNSTLSLALWLKGNGTGTQGFIENLNIVGNNGWYLRTDTNKIWFVLYANVGTGIASYDGEIRDGRWHYLVATYDGSRKSTGMRIYLDGVDVTSSRGTDPIGTMAQSRVVIGSYGSGIPESLFNGTMDEVMIVNRTLSPDEIHNLYLGGAQRHGGDLVGWWKFNDGSGNNTIDGSGSGNTGTLTNGPTWMNNASCKLNGCLSFNGVNNEVDVYHQDSLNPTSSATFSFWINPRDLSTPAPAFGRGILGKGAGPDVTAKYYFRFDSGPVMDFAFNNGHMSYSSSPSLSSLGINAGSWSHVTFVADDSTQTAYIYVNGTRYGGVISGSSNVRPQNTINLTIGGDSQDGWFNGTIDNVKVWKRALTPDEVMEEFRQTQDQYSQYGAIHRVASADDLPSLSYNLTDHDSFSQIDYDQRRLLVSFTAAQPDTTPPVITVQSPANTTYGTSSVWANVTLNEAGSACMSSVDAGSNATMTNSSGNWNSLMSAGHGPHSVIFYCNDTSGNMAASSTTFFTATKSNLVITGQSFYSQTGILLNSGTVKATLLQTGETNSTTISSGNWQLPIQTSLDLYSNKYAVGIFVNDTAGKSGYYSITVGTGPPSTAVSATCTSNIWKFNGIVADSFAGSLSSSGNVSVGIEGTPYTNTTFYSNGFWEVFLTPCLVPGTFFTADIILTDTVGKTGLITLRHIAK